MKLATLPAGSLVIDVNRPLTAALAQAILAAGYVGVMRYIPRELASSQDLSKVEIGVILDHGLVFGVVQHVKSAKSWVPTEGIGREYGRYAWHVAELLALPHGAILWCDLEGVASVVPHVQTDGYATAWGWGIGPFFQPGLYVGWHADLTAVELYQLAAFHRYWGAYNLNADEYPAVRGLQLKQHESVRYPAIAGLAHEEYDVNEVLVDRKGDLPVFIGA